MCSVNVETFFAKNRIKKNLPVLEILGNEFQEMRHLARCVRSHALFERWPRRGLQKSGEPVRRG